LPLIYKAYEHASRNEVRELIELDAQLIKEVQFKPFLTVSHHVGKRQLNKLRGLKDSRVLQRYRDAVLEGKAHGWHTVVYGLVLATYSIPLRQGLVHYGRQTISGFVYSAGRSLHLSEEGCGKLIEENVLALPALVEQTIGTNAFVVR
jgi:urease accessory protein UreF